MSGSRRFSDVLRSFSSGCEVLAEAASAPSISQEQPSAWPSSINPKAILTRAIESEVIPRLMLSHRRLAPLRSIRRLKPRAPTAEEIIEFARICVNHDVTVAATFVDSLNEQGVTMEVIFTKLFAPAARHLGELWELDRCSFTDVTIGLSRIQQLIHEFSPFFQAESERPLGTTSALLVPCPGEHHGLGIMLVEEYFRRAGWSVWSPNDFSDDQLVNAVKQERFDMVGISVTCELQKERMAVLIKSIKAASRNWGIVVMVGGRIFNDEPSMVAKIGADATDRDGSNAVSRFELIADRSTHQWPRCQ